MMKLKNLLLIIIFMSLICSSVFAFDPIIDLNEVAEIYLLNKELLNIEYYDAFNEANFISKLKNLWFENSLKSVFFKNYLLQSENSSVKESVMKFIKKEQVEDIYAKAIRIKYSMVEQKDANNLSGVKMVFDGDIIDEKINYSLFTINEYFSDKLRVIYPWNGFSQFSASEGDNFEDDKILMIGGGTNTVTIFLDKYTDETGEEYEKLLKPGVIIDRYEEIYQFDVEEYMFNNEAVEKARFIFAEGFDSYFKDSIRNFDCYLVIKTRSGVTYKVNYFVNMSIININYDNYYDLARLFCMYCLMTVAI